MIVDAKKLYGAYEWEAICTSSRRMGLDNSWKDTSKLRQYMFLGTVFRATNG